MLEVGTQKQRGTTEDVLCLCVLVLWLVAREFPPRAMALHTFATELASIAIVMQEGPGLWPLYSGCCECFQGMVVIE